MKRPIYLDHHATTPLEPAVLEAMLPYLTEKFGNASSRTHAYGWEAEEAVETAREQVAALIHARPEEIIFTSGATESDNLAIKGVAWAYRDKGNHIITATTEHKAVLDTCKALEKQGFVVTYLPVDRTGLVDPDDVRRAITPRTILISIMYVNSEIGTIGPVAEIGAIAREHGVLFHTDAVQGVGKIACEVDALHVDLLSISGHKIYGPKGIGALYVRRPQRLRLQPLIDGGGHERGLRSGTLNVPGIVGLGKACELCRQLWPEESVRLRRLRQRLYEGITRELDDVYLNGHPERRVPGNLNLSFAYVEGEALLFSLKDVVALSSGSACTSDSHEPSYVLRAIGVDDTLAHSAIRFGLGRHTTEAEIDTVIAAVVENVRRLRALAPIGDLKARLGR
ncbi:MAG: cysteine desulfurase IscS [Candidatus Tectimicrobiota bacterium]|nr:MAG: cysteine desulfurase IscS [Candidatus Tectomicrobia bacterium]